MRTFSTGTDTGSGSALRRMLVKTPYPERHLEFGQKLLSSFGALWTPDPLYLANVSSYNKQLDLGRISSPPQIFHLGTALPLLLFAAPVLTWASAQLHP